MRSEKDLRRQRISIYLDGECDAAERDEIERKIAHDPEWKFDFHALEMIRDDIATLMVRASERERDDLALAAKRMRRFKRRWPLWATGIAAAAALLWFVAHTPFGDRESPVRSGGRVAHYYQAYGGGEGELVSLHVPRPY